MSKIEVFVIVLLVSFLVITLLYWLIGDIFVALAIYLTIAAISTVTGFLYDKKGSE